LLYAEKQSLAFGEFLSKTIFKGKDPVKSNILNLIPFKKKEKISSLKFRNLLFSVLLKPLSSGDWLFANS
jgi:hypothetical protein